MTSKQQTLLRAGGAGLAVLGLLLYLLLGPRAERHEHVGQLFDALDRLLEATESQRDFSRRWSEAMNAWQELDKADPEFQNSPVVKEISATMGYLGDWRAYHDLEKVKTKEVLMKLSEVPLHPPSEADRSAYRQALEFGMIKRGSPIEVGLYLSPWANGADFTRACLERARGHLRNAKILAGSAGGRRYTPPPPRTPQDWQAALPPEHPEKTAQR